MLPRAWDYSHWRAHPDAATRPDLLDLRVWKKPDLEVTGFSLLLVADSIISGALLYGNPGPVNSFFAPPLPGLRTALARPPHGLITFEPEPKPFDVARLLPKSPHQRL